MNTRELFYEIIEEAKNGRIKCYFTFNVLFETMINNKMITTNSIKYDNTLVPVLKITDESKFFELLDNYLMLARDFYNDDKYITDIDEEKDKKKALLTVLWSNATNDDFANPLQFLDKRISFIKNNPLENIITKHSNILNSNIEIFTEKECISNETPYNITIKITNETDELYLPVVRVGIKDNTAYIYSIQNKHNSEKNSFSKKIKRKFYLINNGFDSDNVDEFYGIGNPKDITTSFVIAANIVMGVLKEKYIDRIKFVSFLLPRWNAHEITAYYKAELMKKRNVDENAIKEYIEKEHNNNLEIQNNITEKFLRTALRIQDAHSGIEIFKMPIYADSELEVSINNDDICNNELLSETYNIENNKTR